MPEFVVPYKPLHPFFTLPDKEKLKELYLKLGAQEFSRRMELRNEIIHRAENDPLRHGVRLERWSLIEDCLRKYSTVVVLGGNQSSKSELGAYFTAKTLYQKRWWDENSSDPVKVVCMHTQSETSLRQQQPYIYRYLPPEWRNLGKLGKVTNISYTQKNGFSDNTFITPDGSECSFLNYQQETDSIEGFTLDFIWADELLNSAWLKTLPFRTMAKSGKILITVTLVHGMIGAIKEILDRCNILKTKRVDPSLFSDISETSVLAKGCPPMEVPILAADEESRRCVVWLHTEENPFNPRQNLINIVKGKPREQVLIRAYGYCESTAISAFPKFSKAAHLISRQKLSEHLKKHKFNLYMSADPGGAKPWVFKYYALDENDIAFLIYESPEFDKFGAWAEPPDRDSAQPKWKRGSAHSAYMGASIITLKQMFKQIEDVQLQKIYGIKMPEVLERFIDPRMGAMTVPGAESDTSFISLMADVQRDNKGNIIGESYDFTAAYSGASGHSASPIEASIFIINDKLDYDRSKPLSPMNMPKFYIMDELKNSIASYLNFSPASHRDCPLKDFIDPDRYFFNMDCHYANLGDLTPKFASGGY